MTSPDIKTPKSDCEALERLLSLVTEEDEAHALAERLLEQNGKSLARVLSAEYGDFVGKFALSEKQAMFLSLVRDTKRKIAQEQNAKIKNLAEYKVAKEYAKRLFTLQPIEHFVIISLNDNLDIIRVHKVASGTVNSAMFEPRQIVELLFSDKAHAVIVAHNHPFGSPEPSRSDLDITKTLSHMLDEIDIRLWDHIIVGGDSALSLRFETKYLNIK